MNISDLQPGSFTVNSSAPPQTSGASAYSNFLNNIKSGNVNSTTQGIVGKFGKSTSPFNPNTPNSQFVDPNKTPAGTTTQSKFMGSLIPAVGQVGADIATAIPKGLNWAGTRIAQTGVQTYNEFQNPGYDTRVDRGNPQRQNAGGTATPLPVNAGPTPTNTSNSEANINKPQSVLGSIGGTVEPQKQGVEGAKQIGEQALGAVNMIGTGAMLENPVEAVTGIRDAFKSAGTALAGKFPELATTLNNLGDQVSNLVSSAKDNISSIPSQMGSAEPLVPKTETPKLSPEEQQLQQNKLEAQQNTANAKTQADTAAQARQTAAQAGVKGAQDLNTQASGYKTKLGQDFANGAQQIEKTSPNLKLNLTNEQVSALNDLKENKNFTLPDKINQANLELSAKGGGGLDLSNATPEMKAQIAAKLGQAGGQTSVSLSPTEAQDLIQELNRSTFKPDASSPSGFSIDQQRIAITNEIKGAANDAFGKPWQDIYSKYSQGRAALDKIDNFLNLDPRADAEDINKQLQSIFKLTNTPEGRILAQQHLDDFAKTSGIDLSDPVKSIQDIADKQTALDEANKSLSDAQKAEYKAQRDIDIAKIQKELKNSTFSGRHPQLTGDLKFMAKRAIWGVTGGAAMSLILYPILRKMISGK